VSNRGRKPTPIEQKIREGVRPVRIPNPPLRTGGSTELSKPKHLNEYQGTAWEEITETLRDLGTLDVADAMMVEAAAAMVGRSREARHELNLLGPDLVEESQRGASRVNAWWLVEREATRQAEKLLTELGLSPTARARLANGGTKNEKTQETLDELLGDPGRLQVLDGGKNA
jgi:P27 family predicted phage terminase small subunit